MLQITRNLVFYNYPDSEIEDVLARAFTLAEMSGTKTGDMSDWTVIIKDGDHTRYEGEIKKDTQIEALYKDFKAHANKHKSSADEPASEQQIIIHDAEEKEIRKLLDLVHQIAWRMNEDINLTFIKGRRTIAPVPVHPNAKAETLDYLHHEYKVGGYQSLCHEVEGCKHQLDDLKEAANISKKQEKKLKTTSTREQIFKKGLGDYTISETEKDFKITFTNRNKKILLDKAVESLNLTGNQALSGKQFSVDKAGNLCLPKSPLSSWTIALNEMLEQQKTVGKNRGES